MRMAWITIPDVRGDRKLSVICTMTARTVER